MLISDFPYLYFYITSLAGSSEEDIFLQITEAPIAFFSSLVKDLFQYIHVNISALTFCDRWEKNTLIFQIDDRG